jgi:hypothetical protein
VKTGRGKATYRSQSPAAILSLDAADAMLAGASTDKSIKVVNTTNEFRCYEVICDIIVRFEAKHPFFVLQRLHGGFGLTLAPDPP